MIEKSEKQLFFVNFGFCNYLKIKYLQKRIFTKKSGFSDNFLFKHFQNVQKILVILN
jgi:hypothetical protein